MQESTNSFEAAILSVAHTKIQECLAERFVLKLSKHFGGQSGYLFDKVYDYFVYHRPIKVNDIEFYIRIKPAPNCEGCILIELGNNVTDFLYSFVLRVELLKIDDMPTYFGDWIAECYLGLKAIDAEV